MYRSSDLNQLKVSNCNSTDNLELNLEDESDLKRLNSETNKPTFLSINEIQSQPKDTVEIDDRNHNFIPIRQSVELHQD